MSGYTVPRMSVSAYGGFGLAAAGGRRARV